MYWLVRPIVGWPAFFFVHVIGIPLVYALGKMCGRKGVQRAAALPAINECEK